MADDADTSGPDEADEFPAIPAATVVLVRDGADGLETLMLRRNTKLAFAGGRWVWPGGRVDPGDFLDDAPDDQLAAARRAAVREAAEESGLIVNENRLVWFSHWTPPPVSSKRFATWFFVAPAPEGAVTVDGGEIHDHVWIAPDEAMRRRNALEIELLPPTWITLEYLARYDTVEAALAGLGAQEPEYFATRIAVAGTDVVALYHGDSGYDDSDPDRPGGRHRLWMGADGWRYERHP